MMKASMLRVTCLSICFVLCIPILFASFGEAMVFPPDNVSDEVDLLIQLIEDTESSDWNHPSRSRKATMLRKVNVVIEQILDGNFNDAYDKMLRDIKPKLTGLKTDENVEPWATRWFSRSWISSSELMEEFRIQCNIILYLLTGHF